MKKLAKFKKFLDRRWVQLQLLLIVAALCMGFIGFMAYYTQTAPDYGDGTPSNMITSPVPTAIVSTLRLFTLTMDASVQKGMTRGEWFFLVLEIARFLSLCATGTALFRLLQPHLSALMTRLKLLNKSSIVVHGSPRLTEIIESTAAGKRTIIRDDSPIGFKAKRQIIAFEKDADTYRFMQEYSSVFESQRDEKSSDLLQHIYLCLLSANQSSYSGQGFAISHMAENCARLYWSTHYLKRFGEGCAQHPSHPSGRRDQIVIIGFGHYGSALLSQALLVNVFLPDTPGVSYHVFGDGSQFLRYHPKLDRFISLLDDDDAPVTQDVLRFYEENQWDDHLDLLRDADRIIIAADDDMTNMHIFSNLSLLLPQRPETYLRLHNARVMEIIYSDLAVRTSGPVIFGSDEELYHHQVIIDESLLQRAKLIHAAYLSTAAKSSPCLGCRKSKQECISKCQHFAADWAKLGGFLQGSNLATADHLDVKMRQILGRDCQLDRGTQREYQQQYDTMRIREFTDRDKVLAAPMKAFLEMEHHRWNRYHYYWSWDRTPNPAMPRDDDLKLHPLLVPFDELDVTQMSKDQDSFDTLSAIELPKEGKKNVRSKAAKHRVDQAV